MVKLRQIAHELLKTVDASELLADPAALVAQLESFDDRITIMRDGKPSVTLWGYEPLEICNWKQNDEGEWVQYTHDWAESQFEHIVQLGDLAAKFDALADDLEANAGGALIKSGDERVAELTPYRPSLGGRDLSKYGPLREFLAAFEKDTGAERASEAATTHGSVR